MSRPVALSVAGSDSSGGAGVVADLKTFEALGVWGTVALTAVTAQNSLGVAAIHLVPPEVIRAQIMAVASDLAVGAAKTGMLGSAAGVQAVASAIRDARIALVVVDPVSLSKHGDTLLAGDALEVLRTELLPLATVITPNLPEAAALVGYPVDDRPAMVAAAQQLRRFGAQVVLVKGGHLADERVVARPGVRARRAALARRAPPGDRSYPWDRMCPVGRHRGLPGARPHAAAGVCRREAIRVAGHCRRCSAGPRHRAGQPGP